MPDDIDDEMISFRVVLPNNERTESVTMLQLLLKLGADIYYQCNDGHCNSCTCDKPKEGAIKTKEGAFTVAGGDENKMLSCVTVIDAESMQVNESGHYELLFKIDPEKIKPGLKESIAGMDMTGREVVHSFVDRTRTIQLAKGKKADTIDKKAEIGKKSSTRLKIIFNISVLCESLLVFIMIATL